jgi:hypothetical protein
MSSTAALQRQGHRRGTARQGPGGPTVTASSSRPRRDATATTNLDFSAGRITTASRLASSFSAPTTSTSSSRVRSTSTNRSAKGTRCPSALRTGQVPIHRDDGLTHGRPPTSHDRDRSRRRPQLRHTTTPVTHAVLPIARARGVAVINAAAVALGLLTRHRTHHEQPSPGPRHAPSLRQARAAQGLP